MLPDGQQVAAPLLESASPAQTQRGAWANIFSCQHTSCPCWPSLAQPVQWAHHVHDTSWHMALHAALLCGQARLRKGALVKSHHAEAPSPRPSSPSSSKAGEAKPQGHSIRSLRSLPPGSCCCCSSMPQAEAGCRQQALQCRRQTSVNSSWRSTLLSAKGQRSLSTQKTHWQPGLIWPLAQMPHPGLIWPLAQTPRVN